MSGNNHAKFLGVTPMDERKRFIQHLSADLKYTAKDIQKIYPAMSLQKIYLAINPNSYGFCKAVQRYMAPIKVSKSLITLVKQGKRKNEAVKEAIEAVRLTWKK